MLNDKANIKYLGYYLVLSFCMNTVAFFHNLGFQQSNLGIEVKKICKKVRTC